MRLFVALALAEMAAQKEVIQQIRSEAQLVLQGVSHGFRLLTRGFRVHDLGFRIHVLKPSAFCKVFPIIIHSVTSSYTVSHHHT